MKALARKLNNWWPWTTPMDRALTRKIWAGHAAIIRANRIRKRPEHSSNRERGVYLLTHGMDPAHCVCNGTHIRGGYCPRCPQPYWIAQQVRFL